MHFQSDFIFISGGAMLAESRRVRVWPAKKSSKKWQFFMSFPVAGFCLDQQQVKDSKEWLQHKQWSHPPHRHSADTLQPGGQTTEPG